MRSTASPRGYPAALVESLLDGFALARRRRPLLVGLSGTQASGKSTLAAQLAQAARGRGHATLVLALDDYYLGRRERQALAQRVHPLLATRGVPGTHHIGALGDALRACSAGRVQGLLLPRFDKGRDSRLPPSRSRRVGATPDLVIVEGWCIGVPAQDRRDLRQPVNRLERIDDADGRWRRYVNQCLRRDYQPVWRLLDRLVLLAAPSFEVVARWRDEAERPLRAQGAPKAMSTAAIRRFIAHYERLTRHALRELPRLADVTIELDAGRRVRRVLKAAIGKRGASRGCLDRAGSAIQPRSGPEG